VERRRNLTENKKKETAWCIFLVFLKLGLTSFGGPVAHIGFFRDEFVVRRKWVKDTQFSELVSLCHFLPGPASSQLGLALGLQRGGLPGSFSAWAGFTLPSAVLMLFLGIGIFSFQNDLSHGVIHGLKIVALVVVAHALIGMTRSLIPDLSRAIIAILSCLAVLFLTGTLFQPLVILGGGLCGVLFLRSTHIEKSPSLNIKVSFQVSRFCLIAFFILLLGLPLMADLFQISAVEIFDSFYRAGSLVFGGGHVVLPLLSTETAGTISEDVFLTGYAAAQSLPGPLFTFASYLGAVMGTGDQAVLFSCVALIAIFAPAFLLIFGVLPVWDHVKENPVFAKALKGVNASVVGLLAATLYSPLWTSSMTGPIDMTCAVVLFTALVFLKLPPWLVVILGGVAGWLLF